MKFSTLPTYIQRQVMADVKDSNRDLATYNMRYYAQNGYTSAAAYHQDLLDKAPTVSEVKEALLSVMKARYAKNGFEEWMNAIPNSEYICRVSVQDRMLSKAEQRRNVQ
jgi:hypothetical protein